MVADTQPLGGGIVLIDDGFEAGPAIDCLHALRDAGMDVALVGLKAGLVTGGHGVMVQPDSTLDRVMRDAAPTLLVIAGGRRCLNGLLVDPRTHRLAQATAARGGRIALLGVLAEDVRRLLSVPVLAQGRRSVREFVVYLLRLAG